jgi:hypothetical protein
MAQQALITDGTYYPATIIRFTKMFGLVTYDQYEHEQHIQYSATSDDIFDSVIVDLGTNDTIPPFQ